MEREAQFPDFIGITGNLGSSCFLYRLSASLSTIIHKCFLTLGGTTCLPIFFWILWCELDFLLASVCTNYYFSGVLSSSSLLHLLSSMSDFATVSILFFISLGVHGFVSLKKYLTNSQDRVDINVFAALYNSHV